MQLRNLLGVLAMACLFVVPVSADEGCAGKCDKSKSGACCKTSVASKTCSGSACSDTAGTEKTCDGGACPISTAVAKSMESLPKMTYLVGKESTCCSTSAAALAKKSGDAIQFVVGKKTYSDKGKAMDHLIKDTETMLTSFTTPTTCSKSGMTSIAGEECGCKVMAGTLAKKVKSAADGVKMSYLVGTEACSCPTTSAAMAKKKGVDRTFVIGETKTTCSKTARLELARARFAAAAKAAAEANAAS